MKDSLYFNSLTFILRQDEVRLYLRVIKEKLYPLFHDVDAEIEKEMAEVEDNLSRHFDPEWDDPADFYDMLYDKSIDYGISLCEINGYVALLSIAGLYHLWERRATEFLIREMARCWKEELLKITTFDDIRHNFLDYGIKLENFNFYSNLNELRLVANAVKHGDGQSLDELRKTDAAILYDGGGQGEIHTGKYTISSIDLYPTKEHIDRYGDAVVQFWEHTFWAKDGEHRYRVREINARSFKKVSAKKYN